eukprot:symbB.v1.2.000656.t1/scaffold28.1/size414311/10
MVLVRDYGRGDLAQLRFRAGHWMGGDKYVRGDGTLAVFLTEQGLRETFEAAGFETSRKPSAFRYQLRWEDSSFGSSWVRLRLPHRPVRRPRGAWAAESADADHAETPAKAYEDVSGYLDAIAASLGKDRATLKIYDPYYCMGAVVKHLNSLGFYNVYNQPVDFYDVQHVPEYDVLVTNPPYSGEHVDPY